MYISGNYIKEAFMKHRYPSLLIFDLILFTILLLMPSLSGFPAALRSVLLILSGLAAHPYFPLQRDCFRRRLNKAGAHRPL